MKTVRVLAIALLVTIGVTLPQPPAHAAMRYRDEVFTSVAATKDLVYGQNVNAAGELQVLNLDLYEPVGDLAAKRPVFIWAHGGFFTQGDKSQIRSIADFMTKRGWVTLSIEYRLDPRLPQGVAGYSQSEQLPLDLARLAEAVRNAQHDMQAAVRWARKNAALYRLDAERIATGGFSAGASASVATAWNSDDPGNSGNPGYSSRVAAAIGTGPTDVVFIDVHPDPAEEPPVANYHWAQDEAPRQTQDVACLAARAMLNVCEVHAYEGAGHSSTVGMNDWIPFLYKWVIQQAKPLVTVKPETLPTIPMVVFPSKQVPTFPGVPIV